ncbi:MAG: Two component transcriptional regulator, winged helix family [Candidatus Gottesmanbacteria bacterium GW2011_GWB1_43_11]|uniref:Two component transcriptional regulator, winged helix family n=1 Tax=Candidatus Gottesmanbacteria bacterium GW2011_GWB1_43_11 TaxID=1618446 RepID=A0A0G1CN95_9BACT|nr:MAG: Two component transcriptional regulator, winged helix family [Candidatus Gottesmanbacteria bacterium GW2011_GWA2_42_16]KKS56166.1 MAG: Two component transcriptional regulator, winged helix family [Candidatus Gottesmanbacteria bacterium GW2011_GWA1_42_26]KKS82487.1 MAG: Two component transcriptional regulator, winged helix family [Candidatus Gottesmanbacteria bacterium GW2011_GWC1_43_10]KKS87210.1 MAG: Two component transcriptional regulator, winged helix family [Candidatus Gottesmanbacte
MRILLIEDETKLAASLKKALTTESYAVDIVNDGESGYETAAVEPYDLIILDLGLPKMDGVTVCQKLRQEKITTPILMLTARDATHNKIQGLDSGADDYLVKPFDFEELLARIRALLRREQVQPEPVLQIDSLRLDPAAHTVTRGDRDIALSAKEYALLEYLMRHPKQILSKTQILEHVWDMDTDPFSNVVDVYIGYLRNKIDRAYPKEPPLIHTVKGLGYKLGNP